MTMRPNMKKGSLYDTWTANLQINFSILVWSEFSLFVDPMILYIVFKADNERLDQIARMRGLILAWTFSACV